jgi:parvulin-like peptidyl-prolyl isomerase
MAIAICVAGGESRRLERASGRGRLYVGSIAVTFIPPTLRTWSLAGCGSAVLLVLCPLAKADEPPVARIDGAAVSRGEVELEFRRAFGERELPEQQRKAAWRATVEQVIDRRLVLAYLERNKQAASGQDVDFAVAQLEKELAAQQLTLEQHLAQAKLSLDELRGALAWKLSWNKCLERYLSEANLQKYFDQHRREFDGTQLRVAHILWKLPTDADDARAKAAMDQAAAVKAEIAAGKLTFAAAAAKHSQAPTAKAGGGIGWVERHQPMPEAFSKAAFALDKGAVSGPVRTAAGIHLITVLESKPGTKTAQEVADELRPAVTLYLFRWIADRERAKAKIEYAGK